MEGLVNIVSWLFLTVKVVLLKDFEQRDRIRHFYKHHVAVGVRIGYQGT